MQARLIKRNGGRQVESAAIKGTRLYDKNGAIA